MHRDLIDAGGCCFMVLVIAVLFGLAIWQDFVSPSARLQREVNELRQQKNNIALEKEKANLKKYLRDQGRKVEDE